MKYYETALAIVGLVWLISRGDPAGRAALRTPKVHIERLIGRHTQG